MTVIFGHVLKMTVVFSLLSQERLPVPDDAARKQADKLVRDIFKDDLARPGKADRAALIRKLLQQAVESKGDPGSAYALLSLAQDQAAVLGDADLLWQAADAAAASFRVDPAVLKEAGLQKFSLKTPEETKGAVAGFLRVNPEFLAAGDFERAEKTAATAAALARRIKDAPSAARGDAAVKEAAALKDKFKGLAQARTTLTTMPDDPAANGIVGRYDCYIKGDWAAGLPRLAKGSDAALKDAAATELAGDPAKKAAVADAWNALAEKESGPLRLSVLRHAAALYRAALPGLSGLTKLKIEKRIEEIAKEAGAAPAEDVDLLRIIDVDKDRLDGAFTRVGSGNSTGDNAAMVEVYYAPPEEYDLKLTIERKPGGGAMVAVGLVIGGRQCALLIDHSSGRSILGPVVGDPAFAIGRFLNGDREFKILINVRKGALGWSVDGKRIFDWKGEIGQVPRNPALSLRRTDTLYLAAEKGWEFRQFVLVPVSGSGKLVEKK